MFDGPIRGGTRGGQGEFKWTDVSADKDRENYLGHSINAPTGRWQKNKDVHWYNRDLKAGEAERLEEIRKVKEAEEDALAVALGFKPAVRPAPGAEPEPGPSKDKKTLDDPAVIAPKEEKRRRKEEHRKRKEEKRDRKELKRARRRIKPESDSDNDNDNVRIRRRYSRSRSPRRDGGSRARSPGGRGPINDARRDGRYGPLRHDRGDDEGQRQKDRIRREDRGYRRPH